MKAEKGFMQLLIAVEVILLVLLVIFGVVKKVAGPEEQIETEIPVRSSQTNDFANSETEVSEMTEEEEAEPVFAFSEEVEQMLEGMTTEEKVAQLFIVSPETLTNNTRVTIAGEGTRNALMEYPVGGMLYTDRNYRNTTQMHDLLEGAQTMSMEISGRPLFEGMLITVEETALIASITDSQEEALVALLEAGGDTADGMLEDMERILYVEDLTELPEETVTVELYCYHVVNGVNTAIEALSGGADMLHVEEGFANVYQGVLSAVNEGTVSEEVLDQIVGRILTQKASLSQ